LYTIVIFESTVLEKIFLKCNINFVVNVISGQLFQIAEELYETTLDIRVLESSNNIPGTRSVMVKFRIDFDNRKYVNIVLFIAREVSNDF
jgi:hypothetical protein